MSEYLPSFIVDPVLRQARRFSRISTGDDSPAPGFLPSVTVPDFQRWYPSRLWATSPPPSIEEDEAHESTLSQLARNVQLWASQINNLDSFPSPPLEPMAEVTPDDAPVAGRDAIQDIAEFPALETGAARQGRPVQLESLRTDSETSLNPSQELSYRSRVISDTPRGHVRGDTANIFRGESPADGGRHDDSPARNSSSFGRKDGSGALPEDDGMRPLRQRITAVWAGPGTPSEKSKSVHALMTESYRRTQPEIGAAYSAPSKTGPSTSPESLGSSLSHEVVYTLSPSDLIPTYAPLDPEEVNEDKLTPWEPHLGCIHYRRNVKMQCNICEKWYTCRLCHDEAETHILPRLETKHMLCMLCSTPQPVSQTCRMCKMEAAYYYCAVCKLWNNDPRKSIYHCDDCGICRLGEGLGKDFFHCKTCAACMSIQAEQDHRCIERSTKCDCPICGEYMFTSNKPVAFMKCGHSIHESCFAQWCQTSYKCPICSKSIANMESQFRRLDRHIEEQPMPEEYRDNRAYIFCNDCNSRSITKYHWLGLKCGLCDSYNTAQLELLGAERTAQLQEQEELARQAREGEAGITASHTHTPMQELTPVGAVQAPTGNATALASALARSPTQRDSPWLLPHSPSRSVRSVSPVVGSYFGTGSRVIEPRRDSYFGSAAGSRPGTAEATRERANAPADDDEDVDFWGRQSPRIHEDVAMVGVHAQDQSSDEEDDDDDDDDDSDEEMEDGDDAEDEDEGIWDLPGHR